MEEINSADINLVRLALEGRHEFVREIAEMFGVKFSKKAVSIVKNFKQFAEDHNQKFAVKKRKN